MRALPLISDLTPIGDACPFPIWTSIDLPSTGIVRETYRAGSGGIWRYETHHARRLGVSVSKASAYRSNPMSHEASGRSQTRRVSGMAASASSVSDGIRQPFTLAGAIAYWNLTTREMTIVDRDVVLESHLSTVGLETGRRVVVAGYRDAITARMVVTRLHLE
jgi:hypothetical protein